MRPKRFLTVLDVLPDQMRAAPANWDLAEISLIDLFHRVLGMLFNVGHGSSTAIFDPLPLDARCATSCICSDIARNRVGETRRQPTADTRSTRTLHTE